MKLQIGECYSFNYESKSTSKKSYTNPIKVRLTDDIMQDQIKTLTDLAPTLEESYENKRVEIIPLTEAQVALENEKQNRPGRNKTKKEKELENTITQLKAKFFQTTPGIAKDNKQAAIDLFRRSYIPENLTDVEVGVYDTDKTIAIYVGKGITKTGKDKHNWISIGIITVEADSITGLEKYIETV